MTDPNMLPSDQIMTLLTIGWMEAGQEKRFSLDPQQDSFICARMGRDPQQCDIVLPSSSQEDLSVSRLHGEIYYQQGFYLKSLTASNLTQVADHFIQQGESALLLAGTVIRLGTKLIQVIEAPIPATVFKPASTEVPATVLPHINAQPNYKMTLTWQDAKQTQEHTLYSHSSGQSSSHCRIGRDPQHCDIALPSITQKDLTVSKLHAEISFDQTQNQFQLINLTGHRNPPQVDGQRVFDHPVTLSQDSVITLGEVVLYVSEINTPSIAMPPTPPPTTNQVQSSLPTPAQPLDQTQPTELLSSQHTSPPPSTNSAAPIPIPQQEAPQLAALEGLTCPKCGTSYTWEQVHQNSGRCRKDGHLLQGSFVIS